MAGREHVDEFNEEDEEPGETIIRRRERFSHELTLAFENGRILELKETGENVADGQEKRCEEVEHPAAGVRNGIVRTTNRKSGSPLMEQAPGRFNESSKCVGFGDHSGGARRASFFLNEGIVVGGADDHRNSRRSPDVEAALIREFDRTQEKIGD